MERRQRNKHNLFKRLRERRKVQELELLLHLQEFVSTVQSGWVSINRSKRGPSSHKAFITRLGKRLIRERTRDFEIIYAMKEPYDYIFTSERNHSQPLTRETLTKEVNLVLRNMSKKLPNKPNLTSHSFRKGFITELWKDTSDIEFVRQVVGHIKVESTASYVENLSEEERQIRMEEITDPKDLIVSS
jgi:integrase